MNDDSPLHGTHGPLDQDTTNKSGEFAYSPPTVPDGRLFADDIHATSPDLLTGGSLPEDLTRTREHSAEQPTVGSQEGVREWHEPDSFPVLGPENDRTTSWRPREVTAQPADSPRPPRWRPPEPIMLGGPVAVPVPAADPYRRPEGGEARHADTATRQQPERRHQGHYLPGDLTRIMSQRGVDARGIDIKDESRMDRLPETSTEVDLDRARIGAPEANHGPVRERLLAMVAPGVALWSIDGHDRRASGNGGEVYGLVEVRWNAGLPAEATALVVTPLGDGRRNRDNAVYAFLTPDDAVGFGKDFDPTSGRDVAGQHALLTARTVGGRSASKLRVDGLESSTIVITFDGTARVPDVQLGQEGWSLSSVLSAEGMNNLEREVKWGGNKVTEKPGHVSSAQARAIVPGLDRRPAAQPAPAPAPVYPDDAQLGDYVTRYREQNGSTDGSSPAPRRRWWPGGRSKP